MEQKKTLGLMTVTGCYVLGHFLALSGPGKLGLCPGPADHLVPGFYGAVPAVYPTGAGGCGGFPRPKNHGQLPAVRGSHYP